MLDKGTSGGNFLPEVFLYPENASFSFTIYFFLFYFLFYKLVSFILQLHSVYITVIFLLFHNCDTNKSEILKNYSSSFPHPFK